MSKKSKSKKVVILLVVLLLVIAAGAGLWYAKRPKKTAGIEASEAVKKSGEQAEVDTAKTSDNKNSNQGQQTAQSTTQATKPNVNITNAMQQGNNLVVNVLVGGATSGTCNLTLTNGNSRVQKSAPIGFQVSYYICQGFSINSSEFNQKGEWTAAVDISTPNGSVQSEPRKVTIQ
jgi:cytoskeletal protein RodZ